MSSSTPLDVSLLSLIGSLVPRYLHAIRLVHIGLL